MESGKREKHFAHPARRKILRIGMIVSLSLLFLEFAVYFGSNWFLRSYVQRRVNEATKQVYLVDFNHFGFSLIRRGFFLDGVVMKPVGLENRSVDQALFELTMDEIAVRNLWFDFFDRELTIGKIYLDNPTIKADLPERQRDGSMAENGELSPIKALEAEVKKAVRHAALRGLRIKELEIDHANLFFTNFLSRSELKADHTALIVRNIDLLTQEEWRTPFNAEGFEFKLENVSYPLADRVHVVSADRVFISSLDNSIKVDEVRLRADRSKESRAYYHVDLRELRVGNVDLNKAFMTSVVEIDELILNAPDFRVISDAGARSASAATGDLNDFIKGSLKSVAIKELSINGGSFVRSEVGDSLKNRIELDELEFKMVGFYIGEDSARRENQFFYGEDAAMDIRGSRIYLGDQIHLLTGAEVSVSSFKDELIVKNLEVTPRSEALSSQDPERLLRLGLAQFSVQEIGLKQMYNQGILHASHIHILRPKVEYTQLARMMPGSGEQVPLGEIVRGFLKEVEVEAFEVSEGTIQFVGPGGQRRNDIGFEQFSFRLDNLSFRPSSSKSIQEQLEVEELALTLDQYRLKLKDNLHVILADQLTIDSKRELVEVRNLQIRPEEEVPLSVALDAYGKASVVDFSIPIFRAEGVDIKAALYEERLQVSRITMPDPAFSIATHRTKTASGSDAPSSNEELRELLLGYFQQIKVDTVGMEGARVSYQNLVGEKRATFDEQNLSLGLRNFVLDRDAPLRNDKTLFSDEIDLVFNNYSFSLGGGEFEVTTDRLQYNSLGQTIAVSGLVMTPRPGLSSRIQLGIRLPTVDFKGVDIEQFLFENKLDLDKLEIDQGQIEIGVDREVAAVTRQKGTLKPRGLGKRSLQEIVIDTIQTSNSRLSVNYSLRNFPVNSIETDFGLFVRGFRLDSAITASEDLGSLYEEVNLSLQEFTFALPDSVHTLGFSRVDLGTLSDEVVFSDFYLSAKDSLGKPGSPAINAKVDQLRLKNNSLAEIQSTGVLDLREMRLVNPRIDLYLDTTKVIPAQKLSKTSSDSSLVHTIMLQDFLVENGKMKFHHKGGGEIPRLDFQGVSVDARDLDLSLLGGGDSVSLRGLVEKNIQLGLKDYRIITADSLHRLAVGSMRYEGRNLLLEDVTYRPVHGIYGFQRRRPFQADVITGYLASIRVEGLDLVAYLERGLVKAAGVEFGQPEVDIFRDKRSPLDTNIHRPMPQELMRQADIEADLAWIRVHGGQIRYFEFGPKSHLPGMIQFGRLNMDMAPFYLRRSEQDYPVDQVRLGVEAAIMDTSRVELDAKMYFSKDYPMEVRVAMDGFAFREVNDFLSKVLFVKAVDGTVTEGQWEFTLDDREARGEMEFGYTDLKLQFLDSLTLERGLGKLKVYTFGANLLAKNSNPRPLATKRVKRKIYQERDDSKFVFSAWWKATFSGLRATIGFGRAKEPKRREEEAGLN